MKKKGDLPHAIEYLNAILNKRGATPLNASASASEFDQQLKLEYIREFWGEGQIFFMFKRTFSSIQRQYQQPVVERKPNDSRIRAAYSVE